MASVKLSGQEIKYLDSAWEYASRNNFQKAIGFAKQEVDFRKSRSDSNLGIALNDLGLILKKSGNYTEAKLAYGQALELRKNLYGTDHSIYAETLINLSEACRALGQYKEAGSLLGESKSIYEKIGATDSEGYFICMNNLAVLYMETEDFKTAERFQVKATALYVKFYGDSSREYAASLNNLATLYNNLGNGAQAKANLKKAIGIYGKFREKEPLVYATLVQNLFSIYTSENNFEEAQPLLDVYMGIKRKILSENNPDYAFSVNEQGHFYLSKGDFVNAEKSFLQAKQIREKIFGKTHLTYANTANALGVLYARTGNYQKSLENYIESLNIVNDILGKENATYLNYALNLAILYKDMKQYDPANKLCLEIESLEKNMLKTRLTFLNQKELSSYLQRRSPSFKLPYVILREQLPRTDITSSSYEFLILNKSVSLLNATAINNAISNQGDPVSVRLWKDLRDLRTLISQNLSKPLKQRTGNTDSLINVASSLEKQLVNISGTYEKLAGLFRVNTGDISKKLQADEAALEFVRFNGSGKNVKDTFCYGAFLLRGGVNAGPVYIYLGTEETLLQAIARFPYKSSDVVIKTSAKPVSNRDLYKVLWQPLLPYLAGVRTVYYSPDGILHKIAFAAIPYKEDSLLSDKYKLALVSSTSNVLLKDSAGIDFHSIALFGGIDYNRQAAKNDSTNPDAYAYVYQQNRSATLDSFKYLPSTAVEVKKISTLPYLAKVSHVFTAQQATESALRAINGERSPEILHIATHGFTLPEPTARPLQTNGVNVYRQSDDPLLRCGLVLAGGNKGWKGQTESDEDDGILTGMEISNLQLSHTKLAVLSACETGIGQVQGAEGVFGLQRAFKMAGVDYVLASLWQVPDKETAEFMELFYKKLGDSHNIRKSFLETQRAMRKKYNPYYWAAFTLIQ